MSSKPLGTQKKEEEKSNEGVYFQFGKELDLPIFLKVSLNSFGKTLPAILKDLRFTEIKKTEHSFVLDCMRKKKHARLLLLEEASPILARQIDGPLETDRYGLECITPKQNYRVYRYKGETLGVFSFGSSVWKIGALNSFAQKENETEARIILNRFVSLALAPFGIIGFWGVPIDEGVVVLRSHESRGEAIFVDIMGQNLISQDGIKKIKGRFNILRLDSTLRGRNIKMSSEDLLGFLNSHSSYFDYSGLSLTVRQMIQELSRQSQGIVHPKENFKPRTDLSL